jgi:hypothetical protein
VAAKKRKVKRVDGPFHLRDFADERPGRPMLHVSLTHFALRALLLFRGCKKSICAFFAFLVRAHAPDPALAWGGAWRLHILQCSLNTYAQL